MKGDRYNRSGFHYVGIVFGFGATSNTQSKKPILKQKKREKKYYLDQ
jgi:hypothetical protein